MDYRIERVYKVIELHNKAFENLEGNANCIMSEISKCLSEISLESWWSAVLSRSHEDFEKFLLLTRGNISTHGSIESNIVQLKGIYNKIKNIGQSVKQMLTNDEKRILQIVPPNTSVARFLNGKGKGKISQKDLELHCYLILWANLRTFPHIKELSQTNVSESTQVQINNSFSFLSKSMEVPNTELYDVMLRLDNFLHSPEGFLYLHKCRRDENVIALYGLLLAQKRLKQSSSLDSESIGFIKECAIILGASETERVEDVSDALKTIDSTIMRLFHGLSANDERLNLLFSDLSSITDDEYDPRSEYHFLDKFPYFFNLRKQLYMIALRGYKQQLHSLFAHMNCDLLGLDNRKIVKIFNSKPFKSKIQREYDIFRKQFNIKTYEFEFAQIIKRELSSSDFNWGETKDPSCFNIPWNWHKVQKLYDSLRGSYIDKDTDVRDFCYALTGCKATNDRKKKEINWVHKEKQSLALFVGELRKRNTNRLKWPTISNVFLFRGEEVSFHSSTQYNQALKSGKYDDLMTYIIEAENLNVSIREIL